MASAQKIKIGTKTVGWNMLFTHTEAEANGTVPGHLQLLVKKISGPRAVRVLSKLPPETWNGICATGNHGGVKAVVLFYPPTPLLYPRA